MDNVRIKFLPSQQKQFIKRVYSLSKLSTNKLADIANVHPRSFRDWRREKLTMTLSAAEKFCKQFNLSLPEQREVLIERWRKTKAEAARIGGINLFKKHGSPATLEGRRKGGMKALANLRRNGIIPSLKSYALPSNFSEDLAEFVGILLGDGGITRNQIAITVNSEADREYVPFICNLGKKLFGEEPKYYKRKNSKACVIYYNGINLVKYLLSIGLKAGNKIKQQVDVPPWIKSSEKHSTACLRGLIDTDGGVFFHKYKVRGKEYIYRKICFSNRSLPLLIFVVETFKKLGFTPKIIDKVENKKVWLYNETEVKHYLDFIHSHNPRLSVKGG